MADAPESGRCYKCNIEVGKEFYCHGCGEFICDGPACETPPWSVADAVGHGHEPDDHWEEFVEDE